MTIWTSPQPWLILQVFSLVSESNLGVSVKAEYQVGSSRSRTENLRAAGCNSSWGIHSFTGGKKEGMRTVFTLPCPLSPCCDTTLLLGSPVRSGGFGEGVSGMHAQLPCGTAALVLLGPVSLVGSLPRSPPSLAQRRRCHADSIDPELGLCPWAVSHLTQRGTQGSMRCCSLGLCSGRGQGCAAAAGGSWKEPLPVSTDPEAKVQVRCARVSLGRAWLSGEGWEFLKAPGVALKRVNF